MLKPIQPRKFWLALWFSFLYFETTGVAFSQSLTYQISALPEEISSNIIAHLGEFPETELERTAFIYSFEQKIQNGLAALGFYRSLISYELENNTSIWNIDIDIDINAPTLIDDIQITLIGDAILDDAFNQLLNNLPFQSGDPIHHGQYEQFKSSLRILGQERGYFDGHLLDSKIAISTDLQTANIEINYDSGTRYRFGEVIFEEKNVSASLLQKLVPFQQGEYFQTASIYDLQNYLQQTGYYSFNLALPDTENAIDFHVPVRVSQTKAKRHYFDLGAGFATDTGFRVSTEWRMPVVNQAGHSLDAKIEYSAVNPVGRFTYSIPLTHPVNDIMQLQLRKESDEYGDITSNYFSTRVGRVRTQSGWIRNYYLRYLDEAWNYAGIYDKGQYVLPGFSWSRTTRIGSTLDPSSGFSQLYTLEVGHSSLGSEVSLTRITARWRWVQTLRSRHRLVAKAELGSNILKQEENQNLPPSLRFFAGGDQSLRGFKYQSVGPSLILEEGPDKGEEITIGGQNLAIGSLEYQYYFTNKWRGAVFTDFGNAFNNNDFNFEYSLGIGIHWISPVGAIRFDIGYSMSQQNPAFRFHINMGAEI